MRIDANGHYIPDVSDADAPAGGYRMTAAEAVEFAAGRLKRVNGQLVRADSGTPTGDGLLKTKHADEYSGAVSYTFALQPGRDKKSGWMAPFMSPPKIMLGVRNNSTQLDFERVCAERRAIFESLGWVK